jgi:hypothetical protein
MSAWDYFTQPAAMLTLSASKRCLSNATAAWACAGARAQVTLRNDDNMALNPELA